MRILIVRPMKYPEEAEISGDLQSMQRVVGGLIQSLSPFPEDTRCDLICNDEGKLMGLPPNRFIKDENDVPYDVICGTFFVVGVKDDEFCSLTDEQVKRYTDYYRKGVIISEPKKNKYRDER